MTTVSDVYVIVTQLRGEAEQRQVKGCRYGLTENGGGVISSEEYACCVNIFESVS